MKKIRIVSPAKSVEGKLIDFAKNHLESLGFEVSVGANAKGEFNYFSGTDEERLADMQSAFDADIDVILCARGGYGSVRILDQLDWTAFNQQPKLIAGYSDITVFHNRLNRIGIPSLHSTVPLNFQENTAEALNSLVEVFTGGSNSYEIASHKLNRLGEVEAEIVGGNMAILSTLCGTDDNLNTDNKILFIEDIGEAIYAVDRMMYQFKKAGKFENVKGLIVGGMTGMKDSAVPFGKTIEEVISDAVIGYDFPLCFNFPAGHIKDNRAILFGSKARLQVNSEGAIFSQDFKGV